MRYAGSAVEIDADRAAVRDGAPPQLPGVGIAEDDGALHVLAGVVLVAIAAADVDERRDDAAGRASRTN